jgi:hypothetical protein
LVRRVAGQGADCRADHAHKRAIRAAIIGIPTAKPSSRLFIFYDEREQPASNSYAAIGIFEKAPHAPEEPVRAAQMFHLGVLDGDRCVCGDDRDQRNLAGAG